MTAGMIPRRTSEKPNTASGHATAMSEAATSPEPPPRAWPCTTQTTGAAHVSIASTIAYRRIASVDVLVEREVDGRPLPFDVGAGAEARPLAGENHGTSVSNVAERRGQLGDQGRVERVPALGPRERDAEDVDRRARLAVRSPGTPYGFRRGAEDLHG